MALGRKLRFHNPAVSVRLQLQQILKNTKAMLDSSHRAMDEWKRTEDNRKVIHHAPPQLLRSYPDKVSSAPAGQCSNGTC